MGLFNSASREAKKQEKQANIARWNAHIRNCAQKNRIAQIQHLEEYLDFPSLQSADTLVMAKVFCTTYEMNGESHKSIKASFYEANGNAPVLSLPVDSFEAFRVLFKTIPFFIVADNPKWWLDCMDWNHGSEYDCDDSYDGKTYFFTIQQESYDTHIKSENDIFVQKNEIQYLSDRAVLYLANIIDCWKNNNLVELVGDYDTWKQKKEFVLSYEDLISAEIKKRKLKNPIENDGDTSEFNNYGEQGEKDVEYALKWLPKDYKKIEKGDAGIHLYEYSVSDESQELDHIVVGPNGVFLIETKHLKGNITIDCNGNWSREINGEIEGIRNPIQQVDRHHKIVKGILDGLIDDNDIHDIICLSYNSCTIGGVENCPIAIVKSDQIERHIISRKSKKTYQEKDVYKILEAIEQHRK